MPNSTIIGSKRVAVFLVLVLACIVLVYKFTAFGGYTSIFGTQSEKHLSWEGVPTHKNSLVDWQKVNDVWKLPETVDWSKVKKRKPPPKDEMHDKWIVVTSIAAPTSDVKLLSKISGWKLLVVGDKKTPSPWR